MRKIKNLFKPIQKSFGRFISMYAFCFLAALFFTISIFSHSPVPTIYYNLILDFSWMIVFSILLKLAFEFFFPIENGHSKLKRTLVNIVPFVLSIPFYFFCRTHEDFPYFLLVYISSIGAMLLCVFYFLSCTAKDKNGANLFIGYFVAMILSCCVGGSLSLIIVAIQNLIVELFYFDELIETIWIFSGYMIFIGAFIAYTTKKYEDITVPKAIKIIFHYTILPLFAVYLAVLYIYFIKAIVTKDLAPGTINPFVSIASCAFMILYLTLECYDNPVLRFFRKFGPVFLLPLVALQIIGFCIRVNAYGFTIPRYFSLLYIIASTLVIVLIALKHFFNLNIKASNILFLIFAGLLFVSFLPKINAIDFTQRSMQKKIEKIYESHNLFKDGKLITESAASYLTSEEKNQIIDCYENMNANKDNIAWYDNAFSRTFGFENKYYKLADDSTWEWSFELNHSKEIDIEGYKTFERIDYVKFLSQPDLSITITTDSGKEYNVTEELRQFISNPYDNEKKRIDDPLRIDLSDGIHALVLTEGYLYSGKDNNYSYSSLHGYVLSR